MSLVRSSILLATVVLIIAIVGGTLQLLQTPDSGGMGQDTYGTQGYGYRAVYDVLRELNIPVARRLRPPEVPAEGACVALLDPNPLLTGREPAYLKALIPWIEQGGRLVVATSQLKPPEELLMNPSQPLPTILETLGIEQVDVTTLWTLPADERRQRTRRPESLGGEGISDALFESMGTTPVAPRTVQVRCEGSLLATGDEVQQIVVPGDEVGTLELGEARPAGTISYVSLDVNDEGEQVQHTITLAAEFRRGEGRIVVVAEPKVFCNRLLARGDNSVLVARLLSPEAKPVIFDEFYHGLSVRGNPLYLLTRPGYAALAIGVLMFTCLAVWREAVFLGPSLSERDPRRRDIGEYITAMGNLFSQGAGVRPFLVGQLRDGVLREICKELSLPDEAHDVELVAGTMGRRQPARAEQLRRTFQEVDDALASGDHWTEHQTVNAMRRLTACLSTKV